MYRFSCSHQSTKVTSPMLLVYMDHLFLQDFARFVFMLPLIVNEGCCSALWCHQQLVETSLYVYFKPAGAVTCDLLLVTSYLWPTTCDQLLAGPVTCETCYLWPVTCGSMPAWCPGMFSISPSISWNMHGYKTSINPFSFIKFADVDWPVLCTNEFIHIVNSSLHCSHFGFVKSGYSGLSCHGWPCSCCGDAKETASRAEGWGSQGQEKICGWPLHCSEWYLQVFAVFHAAPQVQWSVAPHLSTSEFDQCLLANPSESRVGGQTQWPCLWHFWLCQKIRSYNLCVSKRLCKPCWNRRTSPCLTTLGKRRMQWIP